ncbi:hypothetical protein C8P64_0777 [Christiangramia gaetbulicola]|uniref:SnoaL-like protein n=1 Tax=Christiangramia gaetbulicola TaxID=703340 RepID=A0A2T6ALV6_9FLAO|nr:hypothetical protein [Christiangramia gaetbulicola]PTX44795.1 hypothetical protein C8P64_0777 [Christiangramia gaetbulicola]
MKKISILLIAILLSSCAVQRNSKAQLVETFFDGFKNSNYSSIKEVIADSLTITEGDYVMQYTSESFYEHYKWDSVFKPAYKILKLKNKDDQVLVTTEVASLKLEFLENSPMICDRKFYFKAGKIRRIENLDCHNADWKIWERKVDSLVSWVKHNQPQLNGFIHDLSMQGALDYLKAIERYKEQELK